MNLIKGIKAKLRNKENLPSWYHKRISICKKCSNNTKNNNHLSLKDKLRVSHNLGKDACLVCSCGIKDLASDPTIRCSASSPKWDYVILPKVNDNFVLRNYSPTKGKLTREGKYHFFNYGTLLLNTNSTSSLLFVSKTELLDFKVLSSCGCTKPIFHWQGNGYLIKVSYNTEIIGPFEKQVSISYKNEYNKKEYFTFWIKGYVCETF